METSSKADPSIFSLMNTIRTPCSGNALGTVTLICLLMMGSACSAWAAVKAAARGSSDAIGHPPIPVRFTLKEPGYVTLVIEDNRGKRIRNLVSGMPFPAGGNVVWWDGTDDLGRDTDAARHGLYRIPAQFVSPGQYRVRGLVHKGIDLHYEFSVYNAGHPAWETADRTGGWLANHTPPSAVCFVPSAGADRKPASRKPAILVGSYISEGGSGLAWLDLSGRKYYGQMWLGGVWTGAQFLARDAGPRPVPGVYAYAGASWKGDKYNGNVGELRLHALGAEKARAPKDARFGTGIDRPVLTPTYKFAEKEQAALGGLAAYNGLLVASLPKTNQLLLVDAGTGKAAGTAPLDDPRGLAFDARGRLLALSGGRLLRFALDARGPARLPAPQALVTDGLEDPRGLALDARGDIYVSDRGASHQVKVYSPDGKLLRAIGKPGAPKAGPYDPEHMNNPLGLTLDSNDRLWVAEEDFQPKRVSVWTRDGKLVNAFYGPSEYGGGGRLDPRDKTRFYYHGMEFKLDWGKGADRLMDVFYRSGPDTLPLPFRAGVPETPLYARGRQYMTNCYNSSPTQGHGTALIWLMKNGVAVPVAALGRANDWDLLKGDAFKPRWPRGVDPKGDYRAGNGANQTVFLWQDANGDGQVQPDEVTLEKGFIDGITVMPDLSFVAANKDRKALRWAPAGFSAAGAPRYDLARATVLADGAQQSPSTGGNQALVGRDGWVVLTTAPQPFSPFGLGGVRNGAPLWSYPSLWPGLHASHDAPAPDRPGELIGTTRLLGDFVTPEGDAGPLWCVNGNMGDMYLFTQDGLFVAPLFQDVRQGKSWTMPGAGRGMLLNDLSLHDENFWPSITQTPEGQVYLVDGARTSLVRVDGLDSIRRLPVTPLRATPDDLKAAQAYMVRSEVRRQKAQGTGMLTVALRRTAPAVDGKLNDWAGADWASIDKSGAKGWFQSNARPYDIRAAIAVAGDRLYAAWRTNDPDLLKNSGDSLTTLFKTGGALDLMIGSDPRADPERAHPVAGDERLLVTRVGDRTRAALYRAVVPGAREPIAFSSPWRTITLDRIDDVSDQVQLAGSVEKDEKGQVKSAVYEISIPLSALGLKPLEGRTIKGDIGILRGNGFQTLQRVYWRNKATGIVSDVPSEAELTPQLWGTWVFGAASPKAKHE